MKEQKLGPGQSIMGFESFEELQEYMATAEREAVEKTIPKQWEITWGSFVIRVVDRLVIFGRIWTEFNYHEGEYELQQDAHSRGYRYGRYYSVVEPEGELGSAHISTLWEITQSDFLTAMLNGWQLDKDLGKRIAHEIIDNTPLPEDKP